MIGLALRLIAVALLDIPMYIDYQGYDELAWSWAERGGYYNGELLTGYYPVGYPFFLSRLYLLFGHAPMAGVMANVLLSLVISFLSYLIARRVFGEQPARWSVLIMLFFPSQILFVNLLASEMVFTPLFLLSLWLILAALERSDRQYWLLIAGGVALGLATLTRSLTQAYWVVLIPMWYRQTCTLSRTARNCLLLLFGLAIVVTPWIVRNQSVVGRAAVSTNGGINFMIGNNPASGMGWIEVDTVEFNTHDPTREAYIDSVGWRRGWRFIATDPLGFFKRGVMKVGYFFAGDLTGIHHQFIRAAENHRLDWSVVIALISQGYYVLVLLFGVLGLIVYRRRLDHRSPAGYLMWATILFWVAVHFVFFGHARFHFPIMPMVAAWAALYIVTTVGSHKSESTP
jgi:4-amino-4-deoxy-L-arabinose transferase-like glycosyltransferase